MQLELISPIKDENLIRQVSYVPSACPPTARGSMTLQSHSPAHSQTVRSSYSPQDFDSHSSSTHSHCPAASVGTVYGMSPSIMSNEPYYTSFSSTTTSTYQSLPQSPQILQQYALQAFMNHVPGQNGEVFNSISATNCTTWAAPSLTAVTPYNNYSTPLLPANPAAYITPAEFTNTVSPLPYHANPDGILVNITQGAIQVNESRAVLVRNLNHRASPEDIRTHFSDVGFIHHCDISTSRKDKRKCTVRLTFSTAQEAKDAVKRFNNTSFMGRNIFAEVAKDDSVDSNRSPDDAAATSTRTRANSGQGPVIVNGSDEDPLQETPISPSQKDNKVSNKHNSKLGWTRGLTETDNFTQAVDDVAEKIRTVRVEK